MLYANLKYDITEYLNVAGRARIDNTYSESEDKRYASTISTFAGDNGTDIDTPTSSINRNMPILW